MVSVVLVDGAGLFFGRQLIIVSAVAKFSRGIIFEASEQVVLTVPLVIIYRTNKRFE